MKPGYFFFEKLINFSEKIFGMTLVTHRSAFAAVVSVLVSQIDIQFVVCKTLKCFRLDTNFKSSTSTSSYKGLGIISIRTIVSTQIMRYVSEKETKRQPILYTYLLGTRPLTSLLSL